MKRKTFKGGAHPYDGKKMSRECPIEILNPGDTLVYPLSQHIGAMAKPLVKAGDRVLVGQKIAEKGGFISANIHSSVSGTVKAIEKRLVATGGMVDSIVVENDGMYEEAAPIFSGNPDELSKDEIIKIIEEAGIVGMGGAGFPTNVKLSPKNADIIDSIIVNGAECEPYLTSDYRRMVEQTDKLVKGLKIVLKIFPDAKGYFGIEDNKPEAIEALLKATENEDRIEVVPLKTKYPQGGERSMIYAVTGRKINSKMLPADVGCIVHNVDTIYAIYNAVYNGKPLIERIVTITGDAVSTPKNFQVRIGTSFRELIDAAGGFTTEPEKIISGGPMMGFSFFNIDVPVVKGSSSLLPMKLAALAGQNEPEEFKKLGGMECVECGCCSYVCPAKRQVTQSVRSMKKLIIASARKK
ncbi:MAG: electron transport complex subunit RsxC [Butyrivibrio sp.]|nr:electron transport complex subunit RsxC [Butyrivibrio sp.]